MHGGRAIRRLLKPLCETFAIAPPVYVRVLPLKRTLASISFRTRTIRLNAHFIKLLTEEELRYVLAHELLHLKYGKVHSIAMRQELLKHFPPSVIAATMEKAYRYLTAPSTL